MTVLPFPGVDLATIGEVLSPRGKVLHIQQHGRRFYLRVWPAGWVYTSFSTAAQARSHAGDLCQSYPLIYSRVVDETRSTKRSLGEVMAGSPWDGGHAA
ncbi:hypothetical protein [uncultured Sphingomonas sp.]|uniref:hypothetical protein n=1 Tax=uncultured Sphingomonas sp. TaxID=158754 RepID=UPI0026254B88|nr:hypothetical protein [uncultured Sphingomonas sp.]